MRKVAVIWAAGLMVLGAGGIWAARAGGEPEPGKAFKPVTGLEDLMEGQDLLFKNIRKAIGTKKWDDAETQAWILAELGNVNVHNARKPQFGEFAQAMSQKCVELAKALKKQDVAASKASLTSVKASCDSCHEQFRKKPKK